MATPTVISIIEKPRWAPHLRTTIPPLDKCFADFAGENFSFGRRRILAKDAGGLETAQKGGKKA
jgi:hypothetical protein